MSCEASGRPTTTVASHRAHSDQAQTHRSLRAPSAPENHQPPPEADAKTTKQLAAQEIPLVEMRAQHPPELSWELQFHARAGDVAWQ